MNISLIAKGAGLAETIRSWMTGWFGAIISIIPKSIYALCTLIFNILDILQLLVRKIAGLDVVYYTNATLVSTEEVAGTASSGDLVFTFIQNILLGKTPILTNVFWAFVILGVILLFLTTLVAVLRSEYAATDSKSASKGKIIGQALKAIASFAIVPIVCFFGIYLANVILQALDSISSGTGAGSEMTYSVTSDDGTVTQSTVSGAFDYLPTQTGVNTYVFYRLYGTSIPTTSTPISGQIFKACCHRANRIRSSSEFQNVLQNGEVLEDDSSFSPGDVGAGVFNLLSSDIEQSANLLDDAFANCYTLKNSAVLKTGPFEDSYLYPLGNSTSSFFSSGDISIEAFDKNDTGLVWYYYDLWSFDWILCIAALVVCAKLLVYLVFGLMKRIFELVILFLVAPPIAALMPLDQGSALKKWREKFTGKAIGAYAPIVGMNLVFLLLPYISSIKFFNIPIVDRIISILFLIVGLIMVKDLVGTLGDLIGADNTLKAGSDMAGEVGQTIAKVGKVATMPARFAVGAAKFGKGGVSAIKAGISNKMDHNAQEGAAIASMSDEQKESFANLSGRQRRKVLRNARLSMSDEDRAAALENAEGNRATRSASNKEHRQKALENSKAAWHNSKLGSAFDDLGTVASMIGSSWQMNRAIRSNRRKAEAPEKRIARRQIGQMLVQRVTGGKKGDWSYEYNTDEAVEQRRADKRISRRQIGQMLVQRATGGKKGDWSYDYNTDEAVNERRNTRQSARHEKNEKIKAGAERFFETLGKPAGWVSDKAKESKTRYENFNALYFGANGPNQDAIKKQAKREREEKLKIAGDFAKAGAEFSKNVATGLQTVFKTLGGDFMKGFGEAGGWNAIFSNMKGLSEKQQGINAEVKNQKKVLAAQDKARDLLGQNKPSGSQKIDISDSSINLLAKTIAEKISGSK